MKIQEGGMRSRSGKTQRRQAKLKKTVWRAAMTMILGTCCTLLLSLVVMEPCDASNVSGVAAEEEEVDKRLCRHIAMEPWDALVVSGVAAARKNEEGTSEHAEIEPWDALRVSGVAALKEEAEDTIGHVGIEPLDALEVSGVAARRTDDEVGCRCDGEAATERMMTTICECCRMNWSSECSARPVEATICN